MSRDTPVLKSLAECQLTNFRKGLTMKYFNATTSLVGCFGIISLASTMMLSSCNPDNINNGSKGPKTEVNGKGYLGAPPKQAGKKSRYAPIVEPGSPVGMGFGIDMNNHRGIPNRCIEGVVETIPQQEGMISLDASYSQSDIERFMGGSTSGGVKLLSWGASARATFSQKTREQNFGLNYIAFAYNKDHSKVFVPSERSTTWDLASPEEWNLSCGEGYVAAQDFGSMLIIKFSLHLNNKTVERSFGSSARGNYLSFAKLKGSLSGRQKTKKVSGTLSVSAIQIGGKPAELGKILKSGSKKGVIENFALCDLNDMEKCLAGLSSIETYMADVFPKQIEDKKNGGSAILRTFPFIYPRNIGSDFNPGLDEFVLKSRKDLRRLYEEEMSDIVTLKQYADDDDEESQTTLAKAENNVAQIRAVSELCYETSTYQECAAKTEQIAIDCAETYVDVTDYQSVTEDDDNDTSSGE
jgi:hypothetical protein